LVILDPEVVADGNHLLAHLVMVSAPAARSSELAVITSFLSSAWHNCCLLCLH
jgi:hypothetical protein